MTKRERLKPRRGLHLLLGYVVANVLLFFAEPYGSPWHFRSRTPVPIAVMSPTDDAMALDEITDVLDSIDLAYGSREPTATEKLYSASVSLVKVVFLPSSAALMMKNFVSYIGPSNQKQSEFTISVKQRYNHLATIAVKKGLIKDGFLYQLDPSLSKKNGPAFSSLRA